ncbi:MAG TPA: hypothetical protein VGI81_29230 [Tepidisphaeraceae bacterium]|jgi:rubrerythrin
MAITPGSSNSQRPFDPQRARFESDRQPPAVRLECRACGYEADDPIVPPTVCPKCHGSTWQRSSRRRRTAPDRAPD